MEFMSLSINEIKKNLSEHGLRVVGISDSTSLQSEYSRLKNWQDNGYGADMGYMLRDPQLLSEPTKIFSECKSIVSVSLYYGSDPHEPLTEGYARVARYAWGFDYHKVFKIKLKLAQNSLKEFGNCKIFTDSVPLLERALASKSGGFIGNNSMYIQPGVGSYFFLGEILCDFLITPTDNLIKTSTCSTCTKCMDLCPTSALVEKKILDSRRCISYLTIEHKGSFNNEQRKMISDWIFGCDICQDTCPFNAAALKRKNPPDESLLPSINKNLSLIEVLSLTDEDFIKRFQNSPIRRAKRAGLIRNAMAVASNTNFEIPHNLIDLLRKDPSNIVRESVVQYINN